MINEPISLRYEGLNPGLDTKPPHYPGKEAE